MKACYLAWDSCVFKPPEVLWLKSNLEYSFLLVSHTTERLVEDIWLEGVTKYSKIVTEINVSYVVWLTYETNIVGFFLTELNYGLRRRGDTVVFTCVVNSVFSSLSTGEWTQGLMFAIHVLDHWPTLLSHLPLLLFWIFLP